MGISLHLDSREQGLVLDVMEALVSSLELAEVLARTHAPLGQLLPADCASMCVSAPERPGGYEWSMVQMPEAFLGRYAELADADFVRASVLRQPNVVLRDSEMVSRPLLERSILYQRCRELNMPLEHVMSVMLAGTGDWHGGLTLYRERHLAFSDRDRALLQRLTPALISAVRNCKLLGDTARRGALMDALFHHQGAESVVLLPPDKEVLRTDHATALLERWFPLVERGPGGLPPALLEPLRRLSLGPVLEPSPPDAWRREGPDGDLSVTYVPLPPDAAGRRPWAVLLREVPHAAPLPEAWLERLTTREAEVASRVLRGWDNQLIADDLGCSLGTVKKHLQRIFDKLGVPSRAALQHLASRRG